MSGFHHLSSSSLAEMGISPNSSPQDRQETHYSPHPPSQAGNPTAPLTNHYQSLGYYPGFSEPGLFQEAKPQGSRSRKKSAPGAEHVKHRRTRSGCYTCRTRRVKVNKSPYVTNSRDCVGCRKGKRDCVYPEPPPPKGSTSNATSKETTLSISQGASPGSSIDDADDFDKESKLESIPDAEEPAEQSSQQPRPEEGLSRVHTASSLSQQRSWGRQNSETPSMEGTKSSSPMSTGTPSSFTTTMQTSDMMMNSGTTNPEWAHLPNDMQYYLGYFSESITHYSYGIPNDPDDFFKTTLPALAVHEGNDALLNAVVGFAAYQATLRQPNGKLEDFLGYYNKSVTLLLSILKRGERQDLATLMTILQLATIEEYLGDWVNLSGHQKAAMSIMTEIFTPESIMKSSVRDLLTWYIRFDVFVALMGGFDTALPREWFVAAVEWSELQRDGSPDDLSWGLEAQATRLRLLSVDMSLLYAKSARGEMLPEAYVQGYDDITTRLFRWKDELDSAITDPTYLVTDFRHQQPLTDEDVVNPYKAGGLYRPPLFPLTILILEWHSIIIMHRSRQEGYGIQREPSDELRNLALSACELFETVRLWPETPPGAIIAVQACLAIACLFIPRDRKYQMWIRRRYASLEAAGYISPTTIRTRLAELFRDPSCKHWWLPNEEGLFPILRDIRAFADARNGKLVTHQTEAVREMSAIFSDLHIGSDGSPQTQS
ncbi:hypothetical protein GGS20DRAFT_598341 [Poronia punctata]|nr:hypothetical protein GGS20DRAFT_598341 [Poronia punctata]